VGTAYRIGFLGGASAPGYAALVEELRLGLRDHGYVEGKNITIEYRWAEGKYDRLPALAAELVRLKVDVIITQGVPAALIAKQATTTIPIVMAIAGNPVETGIVASLARPGGNVTGSAFFLEELNAKRLEFMKTLVPDLVRAGVLMNPDKFAMVSIVRIMEERAQALNVKLQRVNVRLLDELGAAFRPAKARIEALTVTDDGLFIANARRIAEMASRTRLPSIGFREYCEAGGLLAYGGFPAHLASVGGVCRQDPQGRAVSGLAHPASHRVRAGDQHEDRQGAGPDDFAVTAATSGRGDPIGRKEL
jgi:putative tryptophan/tyrosine transport system substrate-binding protein